MTPAARYGAAIEILNQIQTGVPAEKALTNWARRSRFAGSKDRAAIRDHVFDVLRSKSSCAALGGGADGRALVLGLLRQQEQDPDQVFTGEGHAPALLTEGERQAGQQPEGAAALNLPPWLLPELERSLGGDLPGYAEVLRARAPVMLRVNLRKRPREAAIAQLAQEGIEAVPDAVSDTALRVLEGARRINQSAVYQDGVVELQDGASQAIVDQLELRDGMRILDYCAGGGGKSLAIAGRVKGKIFAHDANRQRLRDLPDRARRAGVPIRLLEDPVPEAPYDLVLCDVPCSGSGSWRRAPEGKWSLSAEKLRELNGIQDEILTKAAALTAPQGGLAYATCSVLDAENQDRVAQFLQRQPDWHLLSEKRWLPGAGGDGFYVARLTRR